MKKQTASLITTIFKPSSGCSATAAQWCLVNPIHLLEFFFIPHLSVFEIRTYAGGRSIWSLAIFFLLLSATASCICSLHALRCSCVAPHGPCTAAAAPYGPCLHRHLLHPHASRGEARSFGHQGRLLWTTGSTNEMNSVLQGNLQNSSGSSGRQRHKAAPPLRLMN